VVPGQNGANSFSIASPLLVVSGNGGNSVLGMGGQGRTLVTAASQTGVPGTGFGGGGGGAGNTSSSSVAGGSGADGIVFVTEYTSA